MFEIIIFPLISLFIIKLLRERNIDINRCERECVWRKNKLWRELNSPKFKQKMDS